MDFARGPFTCFFSKTTPQRPENIHSSVPVYWQCLHKPTAYCEKAHPHNSCRDAWSIRRAGCRRCQRDSVAVQQQNQHQYHWRGLCVLRFADAARSYTTVGTRIGSKLLGRRVWVSGAALVRPAPGSSTSRRFLPFGESCHHETWLDLDFVDWRSAQSDHERHDRRILLKERLVRYHHGQQKRRISDFISNHALFS